MADYKIFPSIGIARVGNSNEFYLAPEKAGELPLLITNIDEFINPQNQIIDPVESNNFQPKDFRDSQKNLRRQGARFRIYYCSKSSNKSQEVKIGELIEGKEVKDIKWTVRLGNKKAIWYEFQTKNGEQGYEPNHPLRNSSILAEKERKELMINPGCREVNKDKRSAKFDKTSSKAPNNTFPQYKLYPDGNKIETLGEIYTDSKGRLIVVGGYGRSGSKNNPPIITNYANNDDWWDDTSDGSVTAKIIFSDDTELREDDIDSAWVLVTPPAYAPQILNLVTLYDTMYDVAVRQMDHRTDIYENSLWKSGYKPSFEEEIKPILERASLFPWVTAMPPKPHTFNYDLLGNPDPKYNSMRQYFFSQVRPPNMKNTLKSPTTGYPMMPYVAGDDSTSSSQKSAKYFTLTETQYFLLQQWAQGKFNIEEIIQQEQLNPEKLTRAALENCVGGPFSPGIEMTWISRNPQIYSEPFRIKRKKLDSSAPLSLDMNLEKGLEPGDITKFMALPWQADFNECSSQPVDGRFVWWWPAQRPEFVYLPPDTNSTRVKSTPDQRIEGEQVPWVGTDYDQTADDYISFANDLDMVKEWHELGFVIDISKYAQYKEVLANIGWPGSYYAQVEKEEKVKNPQKAAHKSNKYRSRKSSALDDLERNLPREQQPPTVS